MPKYQHDIINNSQFGRCKLFGNVDIIIGDVYYSKASLARQFNHLCCENAIHIANHKIILTNMKKVSILSNCSLL